MPIAFRPRLPRRARARRAASVAASAAERTQPQIERLSHEGLEWIHIEQPGPLERAWLAEHCADDARWSPHHQNAQARPPLYGIRGKNTGRR